MDTKPEGFSGSRRGPTTRTRLESDMRQRLPLFYAIQGHDRLPGDQGHRCWRIPGPARPPCRSRWKRAGVLRRHHRPDRQPPVLGGRAGGLLPVRRRGGRPERQAASSSQPFNRAAWETATTRLRDLYVNTGYIYSRVTPEESRRIAEDGTPVIDLRWRIEEGAPATVNRINIVGNDVTHESVIRSAIVHPPGRGVQPRAADSQLPEHLATSASSSTAAPARRGADRERPGRGHHVHRGREAAPATSTSAPRWGRARASAGSSGWRSRTCSGGASAAGSSGSSART